MRRAVRRRNGIIALLTDFGESDGFVGQMKGVLLQIAPHARLVDISHGIPAGDVRRGALVLSAAAPAFPTGTVFLAVVDPGVGSTRLPLAVRSEQHLFAAPDNGLLTPFLNAGKEWEARALENPLLKRESVSHTFHGRDVFAPAAGMLANGFSFSRVGPVVDVPVRLQFPLPLQVGQTLQGVILSSDHFGNLQTNITQSHLLDFAERRGAPPDRLRIRAGPIDFGEQRRFYSETAAGQPVAIINSAGQLELAVNGGRAADLGIEIHDPVTITAGDINR